MEYSTEVKEIQNVLTKLRDPDLIEDRYKEGKKRVLQLAYHVLGRIEDIDKKCLDPQSAVDDFEQIAKNVHEYNNWVEEIGNRRFIEFREPWERYEEIKTDLKEREQWP